MASSTQNHHHHFPPATTSAPPPTPSTTTTTTTTTASTYDADLLSRLLHRLPPSLTTTATTPLLLRRRSSLSTTTTPPIIPFNDLTSSLSSTLPTISELGFFQLTNHNITSELARSAESDSVNIFNLSSDKKQKHFPKTTWPLGFDDEDDDDATIAAYSLFLDSSCSTDSTELELSSLREFTSEMEKVGLAVVEALTYAVGLRNPVLDDPDAVSTLMWVSDVSSFSGDKMVGSGRFYPYVVGLHYYVRSQSCSLLTDAGLVSVLPEVDSILITIGDIAQVWSNGKLKKVRGKPNLSTEEGCDASSISMSLLVTLPLDTIISPLYSRAVISGDGGTDHHDNENKDVREECSDDILFGSFSFEDYAWRVYHERVPLKDPLDRYRNKL